VGRINSLPKRPESASSARASASVMGTWSTRAACGALSAQHRCASAYLAYAGTFLYRNCSLFVTPGRTRMDYDSEACISAGATPCIRYARIPIAEIRWPPGYRPWIPQKKGIFVIARITRRHPIIVWVVVGLMILLFVVWGAAPAARWQHSLGCPGHLG
jgi:hypothetical protein